MRLGLPAGLEEAQFKRDGDGWLFTVANPWVIGPRRTYIVNDAQKPALAERVRSGRRMRLAALTPCLALLIAVYIKFPSLLDTHTLNAWLAYGAFSLITAAVILQADYQTLRPLLRDLPRTSRKVKYVDMWRNMSPAMSVKSLAIFTLIMVLGTASSAMSALIGTRPNLFAAFAVIPSALCSMGFAWMLIMKLRAKGGAG